MTLKKERRCKGCNLLLPYSEFRKRTGETAEKERRIGEPYGKCKSCNRKDRIAMANGNIDYQLKHLCWAAGRRIRRKHDKSQLNYGLLRSIYDKQEGRCAISGVKMTAIRGRGKVYTNISIDRIDSNIGYTPDNIQLVCTIINAMKNTMTEADLLWWCRQIADNLGRRKVRPEVQY